MIGAQGPAAFPFVACMSIACMLTVLVSVILEEVPTLLLTGKASLAENRMRTLSLAKTSLCILTQGVTPAFSSCLCEMEHSSSYVVPLRSKLGWLPVSSAGSVYPGRGLPGTCGWQCLFTRVTPWWLHTKWPCQFSVVLSTLANTVPNRHLQE